MTERELHVHVRHEDGVHWATVEEFPGVFATGDDLDELRDSGAEGIALVLTSPGEQARQVSVGELHPKPVATAALVCA